MNLFKAIALCLTAAVMSTAQPASATPILSEITFSAVAFRDNIGNYYFYEPKNGRLSRFLDP
jgi:hypothetical protein